MLNLANYHNSPDRSTKSTRLNMSLLTTNFFFRYSVLFACLQSRQLFRKLALSNDIVLPQFVNTGFQVLFHSPPGVLFTVPSQYYSLSVTEEYLALRGGPRAFRQGFSCLNVLWILLCHLTFRVRDFHPLWSYFPEGFH